MAVFAAAHDFPDRKVAGLTLKPPVVLLHHALAFWAGGRESLKRRIWNFASLDTTDHILRQFGDVTHELGARQLALFHLFQLVLPITG